MKIFSWMQNKLNAKQLSNKSKFRSPTSSNHIQHVPCKEEFSDWPDGLLAIGTLGIVNLKNPDEAYLEGNINTFHTQPQNIELHKDSNVMLHTNLDVFEPSPVSMESLQDDATENEVDLQQSTSTTTSLARRRGMDICLDKKNIRIQKKSLSFLLKKTFLCGAEISPPPVIKDPFPEPKLDKTLRILLHKRLNPRSPSPRGVIKKYLNKKTVPETNSDEELSETSSDGGKWVRTDSEYIVLEI